MIEIPVIGSAQAKRQRTAALHNLAEIRLSEGFREASWGAAVFCRFSVGKREQRSPLGAGSSPALPLAYALLYSDAF